MGEDGILISFKEAESLAKDDLLWRWTRMSKSKLVRSYPRLFTGRIAGVQEYVHHRVRSVTIAAPGIGAYADRERFGPLPLTVECVPGALEVIA